MYEDLGINKAYFGKDESALAEPYANGAAGYNLYKFDSKEVTARSVDKYNSLDMEGPENSGLLSDNDEDAKIFTNDDLSSSDYAEGEEPSAPETKSVTKNSVRTALVKYAEKFIGGPYVYGGISLTKGIDCSGFSQQVYAKFGYKLSRTAAAQYNQYKKNAITTITPDNLKKGDLIFYSSKNSISCIDHVVIYAGSGRVVHAGSTRTGIHKSDYNYRTPVAAVRIIE